MDREKFWVVWREGHGMPKKKHFTKESADTEAARLASECIGDVFLVLECVSGWVAEKPEAKEVVFCSETITDSNGRKWRLASKGDVGKLVIFTDHAMVDGFCSGSVYKGELGKVKDGTDYMYYRKGGLHWRLAYKEVS